jgi:hypothetical protein
MIQVRLGDRNSGEYDVEASLLAPIERVETRWEWWRRARLGGVILILVGVPVGIILGLAWWCSR